MIGLGCCCNFWSSWLKPAPIELVERTEISYGNGSDSDHLFNDDDIKELFGALNYDEDLIKANTADFIPHTNYIQSDL